MIRIAAIITAAMAGMLSGCFGPKAEISVIETEIQKTKSVENIIIPDVSGIDTSGSAGKALTTNATNAYGKRARPMSSASELVPGNPEGLGDLLASFYQAEFIRAVDQFVESDGEKRPEALALPSAKLDFPVGKGKKSVRTIAKKLKADAATVTSLAKALRSGDVSEFLDTVEKSPEVMAMVRKMNDYVFRELDVTYVLLTHISGTEADWKAGKKIVYSAALVNAKTGNLRYFASVDAERGSASTSYLTQVTGMADKLFDAVNAKDELPPPPVASSKTGKKKKKTAGNKAPAPAKSLTSG